MASSKIKWRFSKLVTLFECFIGGTEKYLKNFILTHALFNIVFLSMVNNSILYSYIRGNRESNKTIDLSINKKCLTEWGGISQRSIEINREDQKSEIIQSISQI